MKPFDLEKALQGAKLVTRDGREVTNFRKMEEPDGNWEYLATVDSEDEDVMYTKHGRYFRGEQEDYGTDVVLADEEPATVTMLPFDLDKALAGAKLVTRDGRETTGFKKRDSSNALLPYEAQIGASSMYFKFDGTYDRQESGNDLFLVAEGDNLPLDAKIQEPNILSDANELIYGERAAAYGPVTENFGRIAVRWSQIFGITVTPGQVGLAMIDLKISRHLNSPKRDNLVDVAGYIGCLDKLSKGE